MSDHHAPKISAIADASSDIYERRAKMSFFADIHGMENREDWKIRLENAAAGTGRSLRDISLSAGLAHGYLQSILKTDRDPTIENLIAVCKEINVSLSYIMFGFAISAETEEILTLLENFPNAREGILQILRDKKPT